MPVGLIVDHQGGKMLWVEEGSGSLRRANLDGTGVENLVTGLTQPSGLAIDVDAGKIYWTEKGSGISRANLDGTNVEGILAGLPGPHSIAVHSNTGTIEVDPGFRTVC